MKTKYLSPINLLLLKICKIITQPFEIKYKNMKPVKTYA